MKLLSACYLALFLLSNVVTAEELDYLRVIVLDKDSHTPIQNANVSSRYAEWVEDTERISYRISRDTSNDEGFAYVVIGQSRQHLYDSNEGIEVTHPDYYFFETEFCWADLHRLLFDNDHLGEEFHGMELAGSYDPADWDPYWDDISHFIDDSDNLATIAVHLQVIHYRR